MAQESGETPVLQRIHFDDGITRVNQSSRAESAVRASENVPRALVDAEKAKAIADDDLHQSRKQVCSSVP